MKAVRVDEILTGVVRRVDVDELHLAGVALLEELEDLEVVALDEEVPGRGPVDALVGTRAERTRGGGQPFNNPSPSFTPTAQATESGAIDLISR